MYYKYDNRFGQYVTIRGTQKVDERHTGPNLGAIKPDGEGWEPIYDTQGTIIRWERDYQW